MVQSKIQPLQLFVLMFLFEIGSSVVVGIGLDAKQDAWIAILLGIIGGVGLFSLYTYLYSQFPTLPLTNYLEKIVGKFIGRILAIIYTFLFLYTAARILRTFCDLLLTTVLEGSPMWAVTIMMMLPVCFACYLGFEVIARSAETLFPWMLIFGFSFVLLSFIGGLPKSENFQPVLEGGWKPVFQAFFPVILSFPFGESIVFANFFPNLNHQKKGIIAGYSAIVISGFILTLNTMIIISILGIFAAKTSPFPLLDAVGKINVGHFFQRMDPIAIILLVIGGFFKITVFLCSAVEGFSCLIHKPNSKKLTIPIMAAAIIVASIFMASNYVEHNKHIKTVAYILQVPLFMVVPFLLVAIVMIKRKIKKS